MISLHSFVHNFETQLLFLLNFIFTVNFDIFLITPTVGINGAFSDKKKKIHVFREVQLFFFFRSTRKASGQ